MKREEAKRKGGENGFFYFDSWRGNEEGCVWMCTGIMTYCPSIYPYLQCLVAYGYG